jgi:hypothetical protein
MTKNFNKLKESQQFVNENENDNFNNLNFHRLMNDDDFLTELRKNKDFVETLNAGLLFILIYFYFEFNLFLIYSSNRIS